MTQYFYGFFDHSVYQISEHEAHEIKNIIDRIEETTYRKHGTTITRYNGLIYTTRWYKLFYNGNDWGIEDHAA